MMNPPISRRLLILLPLLAALALSPGCATLQRMQYQEIHPASGTAVLLDLFHEGGAETVRGIAAIRIDQPSGASRSQRFAMAVGHPSYLRLESLPSFGIPPLYVSLVNGSFKVYVPAYNRFYLGSATKENLFSFLNVYLSPEEIPSLLTGTPPLAPAPAGESSLRMFRNERGDYRIDLYGSDGRILQSSRVNSRHELTGLEVFDEWGRRRYEASFSNHLERGNRSYPERITLKFGEPDPMVVTVQLSDFTVTVTEDPSFFDLPVPTGAQIILLD